MKKIEKLTKEFVDIMENGQDEDTRGLKKVDRGEMKQWTRKVNEEMKDIQTETITVTNKLIRAASVYIAWKVGLRTGKGRRKGKQEPRWKRRKNGSIGNTCLVGAADNIQRLMREKMEYWKIQLTCSMWYKDLGEVTIRRGIFQGGFLIPFVICDCIVTSQQCTERISSRLPNSVRMRAR